MSSRMLRGRFKGGISPLLLGFSSSVDTDREMFLEDVWGSQAHVLMLVKQEIITKKDAGNILASLEEVRSRFPKGKFKLDPELEDIHLNIESHVIKRCGMECGGRMHTARSRNDQVLTDTKLHLRGGLLGIEERVIALQKTLLGLSEKYADAVMPGYTHLQHAQPITFGFWAASYASMLFRDMDRLLCTYVHVNSSPLGACALAGTSFPTDRKFSAELLGFDIVHEHSLDAVGSRDFIAETLAALAVLMCNLSKLSEDLVLFSSSEFGFIEFSDDYATGSSIMPQKKNPDMAELVRGRTGRVYGALMQILTTLKGLPSGYNRDLQEDRKPLWNAVSIASSSLEVIDAGLSGMKVNTGRMSDSVRSGYSTATELANYLVRESGLSFREAYSVTGGLVKEFAGTGRDLTNSGEVEAFLKKKGLQVSEAELSELLDPLKVVSRQKSLGGTAPSEVKRMAAEFREKISLREKDLKARAERMDSAKKSTEKLVKKFTQNR
ncbi:MAG: argininosuccinate lyase [Candidatus Altiarchaeota archaeon]|nr:argininosuccinate lyase [Candidatus Altiarchaeota archaeon]